MIYKLIAWILVTFPSVTNWLFERAKKTPHVHLPGYMNRYWLFNKIDVDTKKGKFSWLPSVRFHEILRADMDQHPHDHPWDAVSMIIRGEYLEEREVGLNRVDQVIYKELHREPGDVSRINFGEYHRIIWTGKDYRHGGVLTLFVTFKYGGMWGFKVNGVKVPWREYLAKYNPEREKL